MKIYKCLLAIAVVSLANSAYAANEPWPTSVEDTVTLTANQRVYLPVLDNDIGEELVLFDVNTTTVELGSVEINDDKSGVYYQSAAGFVGDDSFWYAFKDNLGRANAAKVSVTVLESDSNTGEESEITDDPYAGWPVATPDILTLTLNESMSIPVLDNDYGLELTLSAVNEVTVSNGSAAIVEDKIEYTPYQGFVGEDSFWYQFTDARGRANSTQVKITVNEEEVVVPPVEPPVPEIPEPTLSFSKIDMHNQLLSGQFQIYGETGGNYFMSLAESASAGSTSLQLSDDYEIKDGQLITYLATDGDYYTLATDTLDGRLLTLKEPLPADVEGNIWNFYDNAAHPNWQGYMSVADFAIRELSLDALNSGKHLMLGDSWFQSGGIEQRLKEKLPDAEVVNKGVGGRTAGEILAEFDNDIRDQSPDFIWLIAGTNDYFREVSLEDYTDNMRAIIEKINDSGAKAIVFDSSVAPVMYGSDVLTELSHDYSEAVENLLVVEN